MRRAGTIALLTLLVVLGLRAQGDPHSISLMDTPLEGAIDSVAPRLASAGWAAWGQSADSVDYYYRGKYYGLRAKLMVTIDTATRLVSSAYVTVGPYSTQTMLEQNRRYFLHKLEEQYGEFTEHDGALVMIGDYGSIKFSIVDNDNGSQDIRVLYLIDGAYYKDAVVRGLKGAVQEVVTSNAVSEDTFMRFSQAGQIEDAELAGRQYDGYGYLRRARKTEKEGASTVSYEYDDQYRLVRRTQENATAGISYTHEYTYNDEGEVASEYQKVYEQGECVMTINLRNNYLTRDRQGNWTTNTLSLSYWEKGAQTQQSTILQKRTISYWE